jgi:broad specificity phosphatase PhoE
MAVRRRITELTLVCHAPTRATHAAAFPADEAIAPVPEARLAGLRRALRPGAQAWTSPALRARQTAEALGLAASPAPALAECGYGRWAGRSAADVAAAEPAAFAAWLADPAAAPHGGEPLATLLARVAGWLDARLSEPGRMVAVAHASVLRAALVHVLGVGPEAFQRIDVAPLGLVRLRGDGRRWTLRLDRPRP